MTSSKRTNADIHSKLAMAADAISRARDDLKERDKQTVVSVYSFRQLQRAVEMLLAAYGIAIDNSLLSGHDLTELFGISTELTVILENVAILPDVVDPPEEISNQPDEFYTG
jgi:HEPN domain-containing protein